MFVVVWWFWDADETDALQTRVKMLDVVGCSFWVGFWLLGYVLVLGDVFHGEVELKAL